MIGITVISIITSCTTTVPELKIPAFTAVRPIRPILSTYTEKSKLEANVRALIIYSKKLEIYADGVDEYIKELNDFLRDDK